ncbi:sensory rhodopsin transducer [Nesterenkonia lutea]|uniref:Sensory rhodopsin transducer n=1 Tax=Nesterenkonia lutea TaxID=272919 RepID=A0ABR9JBQ3_9MICC|nr:sensory rhodopsin transducer [Nesterenkonia lutea]MBE1523355.1 hypothetical protein [Nesterenkonia lutea]
MSHDTALGRTSWAFAAGFMPEDSTGHEPEFTSRDELCLLNMTSSDACAEVTVYHPDRDPVGPYTVEVPADRVRHVRINDLIDPQAVPLGVAYGLRVETDVPLAIQLRHLDTRQAELGVAISSGVSGGR